MSIHPRPIVFCGPSGSGKSTLVTKMMQEFPDKFGFSVSHTTRKPRPGEIDGNHYHFTNKDVMQKAIEDGKFIETATFSGNLYGTSRASVDAVTNEGKVCVLDIDAQGVKQIKSTSLKPWYIFVEPPSLEELERRLRARNTETEESLKQRLTIANEELIYGASSTYSLPYLDPTKTLLPVDHFAVVPIGEINTGFHKLAAYGRGVNFEAAKGPICTPAPVEEGQGYIGESEESTDEVETKESTDKVETEESTDEVETKESTDKVETEESTDEVETKESTDKVETEESNDEVETKKSTDKVETEESTDEVETKESTDKVDTEESTEEEREFKANGPGCAEISNPQFENLARRKRANDDEIIKSPKKAKLGLNKTIENASDGSLRLKIDTPSTYYDAPHFGPPHNLLPAHHFAVVPVGEINTGFHKLAGDGRDGNFEAEKGFIFKPAPEEDRQDYMGESQESMEEGSESTDEGGEFKEKDPSIF